MKVLLSCNEKAIASPLLQETLAFLREKFSLICFTGKENAPAEGDFAAWVVLGGDGTLHHVVNQLMERSEEERCPICYLPSGTGNDFARTLGLTESAAQLPEAFSGEHFFPISVGQCNERYFVNMASGGIFATITPETSDQLKGIAGSWSYFLTGVGKLLERRTVQMSLNGEAPQAVLGFFVANARYAGGGVQIVHAADPFSPRLHFLLVPDMATTELIALGVELQKEKPDLSRFPVRTGSAEELSVRFDQEVPINLDGEQVTVREARFRVQKNAVKIFVPGEKKA